MGGEILIGVVITLIAIAIANFVSYIVQLKSEFSGYWLAEVLYNSNPVKADIYKVRHSKSTGKIMGKYQRVWSASGNDNTKGASYGILNGDCIMSVYSSRDKTVDTRGCSFVYKDDSRMNDANPYFVGKYFKKEGRTIHGFDVRFQKLPKGKNAKNYEYVPPSISQ
jgi:hypothetical protein